MQYIDQTPPISLTFGRQGGYHRFSNTDTRFAPNKQAQRRIVRRKLVNVDVRFRWWCPPSLAPKSVFVSRQARSPSSLGAIGKKSTRDPVLVKIKSTSQQITSQRYGVGSIDQYNQAIFTFVRSSSSLIGSDEGTFVIDRCTKASHLRIRHQTSTWREWPV